MVSEARLVTSKMRLSDFYIRTDIVQRKENYDNFMRGMLTQHAQGQDQFFTEEVSFTVCYYIGSYRKITKSTRGKYAILITKKTHNI